MNNRAFTLAEVLITLGIIGVVAAITLPMLITNINERVNSERQANIALKVTQGMEKMKAMGKLNETYDSTESFVAELKNHLKIIKTCDKDNLAGCWPTKTVTASDGEEYNVSDFKTGKKLGLYTSTNNVGIVLADGGAFILNYNPEASTIDVGDPIKAYNKSLPVGGGNSKEMPYSSNVTSSIDFVMDVNGGKGPNRETIDDNWGDIRSFTAASFSGCGGVKISGLGCVVDIGLNYEPTVESATYVNTSANMTTPITEVYSNYFQGAKNKCSSMNGMHLASSSEIKKISTTENTGISTSELHVVSDSASECGHPAGRIAYPCQKAVSTITYAMFSFPSGKKTITSEMQYADMEVDNQQKAICVE